MQEKGKTQYQKKLPDQSLADFVDCFWTVRNPTSKAETFTILPDGYFDLIFRLPDHHPKTISLTGLWTKEMECVLPAYTTFFAISFKLLAADYILKTRISALVDSETTLPTDFWNVGAKDLSDFNSFVHSLSAKMLGQLDKEIDPRKLNLGNALYASRGTPTVKQISEDIFWSSRQMNRYFTSRFGISLKAYCNILRYRASFEQLKEGQLYPEQTYFDQAHFIKEVKKYSGATPKNLSENKNDRFIQLSTLPKK